MAEQATATGARGWPLGLPRALVRQLVLLVPVCVDLAVTTAAGRAAGVGAFYAAGLALVLVTTVLAALSGRSRRLGTPRAAVAYAVTDLAALGLMRLVPDGNGLAILSVLPAMWLASDLRMRGAGAALVGVLALVSAPSLLYFGSEPAVWSAALTVPVVAAMCAVTVAGTTQVWLRQNRELEEQGRRLEGAVAEAVAGRALNEAIIGAVDVGLVALDLDGTYRSTNPRQRAFMALAFPDGAEERAGQPGEAYRRGRTTPMPVEEALTLRALRGEQFAGEVIWVGRPGSEQKALSVSATPILDAEGNRQGAVLAYHDITDLMNALSVKDDFVASVSHELRTPLTSILGFLEVILDDPRALPPQVHGQLDVVRRNAERLLRLVADLLFTAQVDRGQVRLALADVDLSALLERAAEESREAAGITVRTSVEPGLVVRADAGRLRQVVDNLLSNALKYTPPPGEVVVGLHAEGDVAVVTVRDTGMGISADDLGRLFTRFFRSEEAERQAIQGVGLGLAITREIVQAHGGTIEVASEVGRGTTFVVRLPRGDGAA